MYTWTDEKNRINKEKHGFYLSDIISVFNDPNSIEYFDSKHSSLEDERYIFIGRFSENVILYVSFQDKGNDVTHLISAREAAPPEEKLYEKYFNRRNS
ncbi:MAG: hypothetical protein Ta2B_05540 [Termitinemataceae bacterium]|nr:MAG: hypothetical protein Ta2B_05540 [Termitinemataceae bacterium]